ncbi:MAG: hypothetical protein M1817_004562 [Caeruleum heppii]|nr:MAG: hypothetical protein M1817_004562 [Caeruleum heppii]
MIETGTVRGIVTVVEVPGGTVMEGGTYEIEVGRGTAIVAEETMAPDHHAIKPALAPPFAIAQGRAHAHAGEEDHLTQTWTPLAKKPTKKDTDMEIEGSDVEEDDVEMQMRKMMGFGGFDTTKMKKVAGNDVSAVRKEKKTEYRQYMNRIGGFNRPLSPS